MDKNQKMILVISRAKQVLESNGKSVEGLYDDQILEGVLDLVDAKTKTINEFLIQQPKIEALQNEFSKQKNARTEYLVQIEEAKAELRQTESKLKEANERIEALIKQNQELLRGNEYSKKSSPLPDFLQSHPCDETPDFTPKNPNSLPENPVAQKELDILEELRQRNKNLGGLLSSVNNPVSKIAAAPAPSFKNNLAKPAPETNNLGNSFENELGGKKCLDSFDMSDGNIAAAVQSKNNLKETDKEPDQDPNNSNNFELIMGKKEIDQSLSLTEDKAKKLAAQQNPELDDSSNFEAIMGTKKTDLSLSMEANKTASTEHSTNTDKIIDMKSIEDQQNESQRQVKKQVSTTEKVSIPLQSYFSFKKSSKK